MPKEKTVLSDVNRTKKGGKLQNDIVIFSTENICLFLAKLIALNCLATVEIRSRREHLPPNI